MQISVRQIDEVTFEVEVAGPTMTTHRVTASAEYVRKLTQGGADAQTLLEASFEFLLAREPNTSILRRFDLRVIQAYFPDYEATMRGRWA